MVGDDDEKGERESGGPDAIDKILIDKKFSPAKKKSQDCQPPWHQCTIYPSIHPLIHSLTGIRDFKSALLSAFHAHTLHKFTLSMAEPSRPGVRFR